MSNTIEALLGFYKGRKLISVKDIKEFDRVYGVVEALKPPQGENK